MKMTATRAGLILGALMIVAMALPAWGDDPLDLRAYNDCPLIGGGYAASVPYQSACAISIDDTDPVLKPLGLSGVAYCDGADPEPIVGYYETSPHSCVLHLRWYARGILIAEEGETVREGIYPGMADAISTDSPQSVCEHAADAGLLSSGEVLSVEATNIGPGSGSVETIFTCQGTHLVNIGYMAELPFGPVGDGNIRIVTTVEPVYQAARVQYDASLELDPVTGVLTDESARITTQTASGEPATWDGGVVTLVPTQ